MADLTCLSVVILNLELSKFEGGFYTTLRVYQNVLHCFT